MSVSKFLVTPDDYGIRPAGGPRSCEFCRASVGEHHADDCVCIVSLSTYDVIVDSVVVGQWSRYDPAGWDAQMCEFHKNESSWCVDNIRTSGTATFDASARFPDVDGQCWCGLITFELRSRDANRVRATCEQNGPGAYAVKPLTTASAVTARIGRVFSGSS